MEKKQSSIEFAIEKITQFMTEENDFELGLIAEKLKAMHKEEVQDAYRINPNNEIWSNSGIDYYNEIFGGESIQSNGTNHLSHINNLTDKLTNGGNNE